MINTLQYDVSLPIDVKEILGKDFWVFQHLNKKILASINAPVKFTSHVSIFIKKGECIGDINLIKHHIKAPCVVNIKAKQILQIESVSDDIDASFVVLSKKLVDNLFMFINSANIFSLASHTNVVNITDSDSIELSKLYADLENLTMEYNMPQYAFQSILFTLVAFFFRKGHLYYEKLNAPNYTSQGRITDKFLSLVQQNFKEQRFLEFYSDKLSITPKHLSRTIKQHTGSTAVEWIERYVILEAKVMLKSSSMTIQQIADELHFPSQSFFGKYFKKNVGVSPKEFRNG